MEIKSYNILFVLQLVQMSLIHALLTCYYNLADLGVELRMQYSCVIKVHYHGIQNLQANLEWAKVAFTVQVGGTLQLCRMKGIYTIFRL